MDWSQRIGRRIRLRDLHILLTVVQCKSLVKAAQQLAISRPVVSKAIADLEAVLGVRLLERDRHGAELTIYGAALLKRGVTVFDELREGVKDIEFLADPTAGEVRIGCQAFLATSFVPAVIDRLTRRYPGIVFDIAGAQTETLRRELNERNVDLLVAWRLAPFADEQHDFETLYSDSYVIATGAQNSWARRRRIELSELMNESWVLLPPRSVLGSAAMQIFRASGLDYPRATVFAAPSEVRMSLLTTGRFLTIVPASALRFPTRRPEIKVLPVELPPAHLPIGIVTLKNRTLSAVARLFIENARDVARQLAKKVT
jgi:DNA-binding transcriptional LysR family regulator